MANTEGYTFSNTDTVTGDRLNTTIRNAVIDLANNTTGYLDGSKIATGTIPASELLGEWQTAVTPQTVANGERWFFTAGDTITLPASPSLGHTVFLKQKGGDFTSSNGTINGGTKNINDNGYTTPATTYAIDANFIGTLELVYDGTAWRL
jgi:hypothetical protein